MATQPFLAQVSTNLNSNLEALRLTVRPFNSLAGSAAHPIKGDEFASLAKFVPLLHLFAARRFCSVGGLEEKEREGEIITIIEFSAQSSIMAPLALVSCLIDLLPPLIRQLV